MEKDRDNIVKDGSSGVSLTPDFLQFVSLKRKKLAKAIYLITSFVSDSEPIKWRLRTEALELLSDKFNLIFNGRRVATGRHLPAGHDRRLSEDLSYYRYPLLSDLSSKLEQIISLLDLALAGGFVSEMNFGLLKQETEKILSQIRTREGDRFLENYLLLPEATSTHASQGHLSHKIESGDKGHYHTSFVPHQSATSKGLSEVSKGHIARSHIAVSPRQKDGRRESIVNFIKGKSWTPITDIAQAVPGCSVKTVQRELSDLVDRGVLKKKGDRRWARYILATEL